MAKVLVSDTNLSNIASSIRAKLSTQNTYTPTEMADAIDDIPVATLISKNILANGTYDAEDDNVDGYSSVHVSVPMPLLASLSVTSNGTYTAPSDTAYNEVTVNVPAGGTAPTLVTKTITENGTYNASSDNADGYSSVTVSVAGGGDIGTSLSNPPIKAISGTFTLESANYRVTVPVDRNVIDLNDYTLWHFFAIIPDEYWTNYEGDSAYDNYASGLEICRFSNYWASTMVSLSITPIFYEPNANNHSWKSGGAYSTDDTSNSITFTTAGSGYNFLAGVEYRYILVCARKVATT